MTDGNEESRTATLPAGFVPVGEESSFIGHIGGLHWRTLEDRMETCVLLEARHTNPIGWAHGGLLMTLLDITLGATAQVALRHDRPGHPVTIQFSCNLVGAARLGALLRGEARVDASTRTMSFVSGRLHVDGRTVATGSAVFRNPPPPSDTKP
jgi:uncharacterized protein (TIGR00369 family)